MRVKTKQLNPDETSSFLPSNDSSMPISDNMTQTLNKTAAISDCTAETFEPDEAVKINGR